MQYKCPAIESTKYLCDRVAEYQIEGTVWCHTHARRVLEGDDMAVTVREFASWQVPTMTEDVCNQT